MPVAVEVKTVAPVMSRVYTLVAAPTTAPKGKQRQIVLSIIARGPATIAQVAAIWEAEFISVNRPIDGVLSSVRYHLHHTTLLGQTSY